MDSKQHPKWTPKLPEQAPTDHAESLESKWEKGITEEDIVEEGIAYIEIIEWKGDTV